MTERIHATPSGMGIIALPNLSRQALVIGDQIGQMPVEDMRKIERRGERIKNIDGSELTIIIRGEERETYLKDRGKRTETYPFVGVRCMFSDIFVSGVGVMCPKSEEGYFCGWLGDVDLLACYRAMGVIGQLDTIDPDGDIYDAYDATRMVDPPGRYKMKKSLDFVGIYPDRDRAIFYDYNAMLALRRIKSPAIKLLGEDVIGRILRAIPPDLESIITDLNGQGIPVDGLTLEREMKWGAINPSPVIEAVISGSELRRKERIRKFEKR